MNRLDCAVQHQQMDFVIANNLKEPHLERMGLISRIWHNWDRDFHNKRLSQIAKTAAIYLNAMPRLSLLEASKNSTLRTAKSF